MVSLEVRGGHRSMSLRWQIVLYNIGVILLNIERLFNDEKRGIKDTHYAEVYIRPR